MPCDPVDTVSQHHFWWDTHEVAVCIDYAPENIMAFELELVYDDTLDVAQEEFCPAGNCLDDNPDANAGATLGSRWPTTPDLGGWSWDCSVSGLAQPVGDRDPESGRTWSGSRLFCVRPLTSPINASPGLGRDYVQYLQPGTHTEPATS
jgi:hypothetical protein